MQKITLPLVMIASLATLASCGQSMSTTTPVPMAEKPAVTGVVMTPDAPTSTASISPTSTASVTPVTPVVLSRKDTVSYNTPEGMVPVEFDVTVTDGVITTASATPKTENEISNGFQKAFAAEFGTRVVGKKAKDLHIDSIGGASLTTTAFETFVHSF